MKSNVDLSEGGTRKFTPNEARTSDKEPSNVVGFSERVVGLSKINDDKQPRFFVGGVKQPDGLNLLLNSYLVDISFRIVLCCS